MPIRMPSRPRLARLAVSGLLLPGLLAPLSLRALSLTASAAASPTNARTDVCAAWTKRGPPMPRPRLSRAASSALARQTEQGAPASLFASAAAPVWTEFPLPGGSGPHDVAPAPDGTVWFTAQAAGRLGRLDPGTGRVDEYPLGQGSAPHGVIVGPDGAPWVTDGGLNAVLRVDPGTHAVRRFPLPASRPNANLNTATFDHSGRLWFTGQNGVYGQVEPRSGAVRVWDAPRGPGPYGIATTRSGAVYFASLAGSYIAQIDLASGAARVIEPPTPHQGARRVWPDAQGALWVSEFHAGQIARFQPAENAWRSWRLPGAHPQPYAVYVDERDTVWVSDFGVGALLRFDPASGRFDRVAEPAGEVWVRQLLGRRGEVWGADSAHDRLIRVSERG